MKKSFDKALAEVEKIVDRLGTPVDQGIKNLVAALHTHGFPTTGSCEGHTERGIPYPWVDIGESQKIIGSKDEEVHDWKVLEMRQPIGELANKFKDYGFHLLVLAPRKERYWIISGPDGVAARRLDSGKENKDMVKYRIQLMGLLDRFYQNRASNYSDRITIESLGSNGDFRLAIMGGVVMKTASKAKKEIALRRYQKEFAEFAEFLKHLPLE